ncbi:hypothetical protein [Reinekea sp. G2M2-21]|uniref:hypothetical protein n=1 Tax=Reinekea sp. G2M2-21 TaxID=2788942 RepID=UPI0018ABF5B7|nr:hypothetical protein [Reinekea sp. G2M2-21]
MKKLLLGIFACALLVGCSALSVKEPSVEVQPGAQFSYSGRGAGAGVALMSTMGPVGIAVGVAIDEGIRKDLEKSAQMAGFDIVALVNSAYKENWVEYLKGDVVTIVEYGMQDVRGSDDIMSPYLVIASSDPEMMEPTEINYLMLTENEITLLSSLNDYKEDGSKIVDAFRMLLSSFDIAATTK